jgi:hypothetical protein
MWNDPEERLNKKVRKAARNGAFAIGGGVGLFFMGMLYPHEEGADHIARLFSNLALVMILYGAVMLATVMFRRRLVPPMNFLMTWLVLPTLILFLFSKHWTG